MPWALQAPWGLCSGGPRCRVHRQGFPPAVCTSSIWGKCSEEPGGPQGSEEGEIGRVQLTLDFPLPPPTHPTPWREVRALVSLGQRPCWMEPVSCSSLCSQSAASCTGMEQWGQDRWTGSSALQFPAPRRLGPLTGERALAGRKPQGKRNGRLWLVV